jgi:hypothetical protein
MTACQAASLTALFLELHIVIGEYNMEIGEEGGEIKEIDNVRTRIYILLFLFDACD